MQIVVDIDKKYIKYVKETEDLCDFELQNAIIKGIKNSVPLDKIRENIVVAIGNESMNTSNSLEFAKGLNSSKMIVNKYMN